MNGTVRLGSFSVRYRVRRNARAKRANLTLNSNGDLLVTLPRSVSAEYAEKLIRSKHSWIEKHLDALASGDYVRLPSGAESFKRYCEEARRLATERVRHFSVRIGVALEGVRIKNQKTQWGSCSESGFVSINYRIVFLPAHLIDYVVAHELCHRVHLNHSAEFHRLLEATVPGHRERERELRRYRF